MLKRYLLLDGHIDETGAARFFTPYLGRVHVDVVRMPFAETMVDPRSYDAVVITGSSANISDGGAVEGHLLSDGWLERATQAVREAVEADVPTLGVCFGHQLIAHAMHPGCVQARQTPEVGYFDVDIEPGCPLLGSLGTSIRPFVSHGDEVRADQVDKLQILAKSQACAVHGFKVRQRRAWGVQFHVEYDREEQAGVLFRRSVARPSLGLQPAEMMKTSPDCQPWAQALFGRFGQIVQTS